MNPDWSRWSEPQLRCLLTLHWPLPSHESLVRLTGKIRTSTIESLIDQALIERVYLSEVGRDHLRMPFLQLTHSGRAVRRDYIRWHQQIGIKLGHLPDKMAAIARLRT